MAAHNVSQRKASSEARMTALGQYRSARSVLAITCEPCEWECEVTVAGLADRYGAGLLLGNVIERLRCRRCGGPPYRVRLRASPGDTAGVTLKGPGAYA